MESRWWLLGPQEWFEIARDVGREMRHDSSTIVAAGVAFYAVLAMLPAMVIAVSVYGLFTSAGEAERQIDALLQVLPEATAKTIASQVTPIADFSHTGLSIGLMVSLIALTWTTSNATRAMVRAVVIAYDQEGMRSPLETRAAAMGLTILIIGGGLVALALVAAVPVWLKRFDPTHAIVTFSNIRWVFVGVAYAGSSAFLYRYGPPIRRGSWSVVLPGAIAATLLWVVTSIGFSVYVSSFGNYNQTYGALGAAIVLLLWFWLTSLAVIVGAQLNEILENRGASGMVQ